MKFLDYIYIFDDGITMETLRILNKKETKEILKMIKEQWDADIELPYGVMRNNNDRIYLANRDVFDLDLSKLKISSIGIYFGEIIKDKEMRKDRDMRLSIEGSQIVGPYAKENVVELSDEEAKDWLRGNDADRKVENRGFIIIKSGSDYLGSGKSMGGKILNYVPKGRRITSSD